MSLKEFYAGREVHLWGFVCDRAGRASMSQYIGSGVLSMEQAEDWEDEDIERDVVMLDDASANILTEERRERKIVSNNNPSKRRSDVAPSAPPE